METYPDNVLPLPSINFNVDSQYSNVRTQMDSGRVRQRPRFSRELELAQCTFELTKWEYGAFVAFWDAKINRGNDWFNMNLPTPNGETLTTSKIRFVSDYKAQHVGNGNFNISATIEFDDSSRGGADYYDLFVLYGGDMDAAQADIALITAEVTHYYVEHAHIEWYDVTDFQNQVAGLTAEVTHYNAQHPAV